MDLIRLFQPMGNRTLITRMLQILSVLHGAPTGRDPTTFLPEGMTPSLSIRQGRENSIPANNFTGKPKDDPWVVLEVGVVEGYYMRVISGRYVAAFEGIPYAEPPTGERRFRDPVPKPSWTGTLMAKSWPPMCPQARFRQRIGIHGSEDCLYLNVYTPNLPGNGSKPLPVIVFLHGGAFIVGSSNEYGPSYLMQQDIVLVTVNYRLGVLGFMSTGSNSCSGNWGLKDQSLAISWVHQHIRNFGGDPKKIVLMGQSAGSVSTHLHMMSPRTKDKLFAAISLSGTAFMNWAMRRPTNDMQLVRRLAVLNFCPFRASEEMVMDCLRSRSFNNITLAATLLMIGERKVFQPVIEPVHETAFISKTPAEYYAEGSVAAIPFLTSITSRELEVTLAVKLSRIDVLPQFSFIGPPILAVLAPDLLDYRGRVADEGAVTQKIFNFYGGEKKIRSDPSVLAKIGSDRHFHVGLRRALKHHMKIAPTYAYYFSYKNDLGFADEFGLNPSEFGVPHGEDVPFLFNRTDRKNARRDKGHFAILKLLQILFTNFATTGEPLYTDEKFQDYRIWQPVKTDKPVKFLRIDEEVKMITIPAFQKATDFWESLGIQDL